MIRKFTIYNLQFTIKILFLLFTFYILHFTFYISSVHAQAPGIGQSRITPASPLYFLKSVREILELKLAGTARVKALRQVEFATRRVREVKSLADTPQQNLIEPTLARYLFHLQQLNSVVNFSDEIIANQITESIAVHMQALQVVYDQVTDPRAQMSIRATIHRLTEWDQNFVEKLNKLSKPHLVEKVLPSKLSGCDFLAQVASSSALNEVEQAVFRERAQQCLSKKL